MAKIKVGSTASFQAGLTRRIKAKGDDPIRHFARHLFADLSLTDLNQRRWEDVTATVKSCWKFYSEFDGSKSQIRILPGTGAYLVIEIASTNLPFLLESLRMELSQLNLVLADVQQCRMGVIRHEKKMVLTDEIEANESLIRLEIKSAGAPADLESRLLRIIGFVQRVVTDYTALRQQMLLWSNDAELNTASVEIGNLLKWFHDNNFTFLGYEEFRPDRKELKIVRKSRLGLARPGKSADGIPVSVPEGTIKIEKMPVRSKVHRPVYVDSVTICERSDGDIVRLGRFLGLFTSSVYTENPNEIPVVRQKIADIFASFDFVPSSHKGRELARILEILPREELFFATDEDLSQLASHILALQERRIVRVLVRQDSYFANCIVYVPKDTYNTSIRVQIQKILVSTFSATDVEFSTYFSESALTRTHFVLRLEKPVEVDLALLEQQVTELTRSWADFFQESICEVHDEDEAARLFETYRDLYPPGYRDDFSVDCAVEDLGFIDQLSIDNPLNMNFYDTEEGETRFKLFHLGSALPLSDVIPILENLGAKTIEEHPYDLCLEGAEVWIHDFLLEMISLSEDGIGSLRTIFEEAFRQIWRGGKENDSFNRLIPTATMDHRQVALIRAYARYFGQLQNANSQQFIADCVTRYSEITKKLFQLFEKRFDPNPGKSKGRSEQKLVRNILEKVANDVVNLADDRILRGFVEMILATKRTNYYQLNEDDSFKDYVSLKLLPEDISEMPEPRPKFEIFVYSPRIEGVHLRGGKIARGGLRWSDRTEDYRTEVLGLVKAQQVKNSVIVPVGAKGGFLPKQIPEDATRDEYMAEGIACYRIFIQGLLDLTDNLVKGEVVKPHQVVCLDDDDTYLVVAADKGTATFSDIANEISDQNGFWLGDAFASGGSVGYDHKAMGITARGAWKSVQQHFRDKDTDIQNRDFSVIGIGDMSGDVFGNGMLLSEHICLIAAFNHLHIFVDPSPNSKRSFQERQRLFNLPRSSWSDYNSALISRGGGVFSRTVKSIKISREMKNRFSIQEKSLTPNQLITAILKTSADLLWNGGIGTYVKSRHESHLEVSDKANDAIRINANQLQCKVIGEGGNLGVTQLARIEFCLLGGNCFSDFIDNAGGVNCSDAEVNIKILLNQLLEAGKLTPAGRTSLLRKMTDSVAAIVLDNNYRQAQTINLMDYQTDRRGSEYSEVLRSLEEQGQLDRQLEFLPSEEEIQDRKTKGQSLTAPEISVLTSYVKGIIKEELSTSEIVDEPYICKEMLVAFPEILVEKYRPELQSHRLRRELVATQIANGMVNFMGMNFVRRLQESTGFSTENIARCFIGARDVFELGRVWDEICALDYLVDHRIQKEMMMDVTRLIRRVTRWLLRNRRRELVLEKEIPIFVKANRLLLADWENLLAGSELVNWQEKRARLKAAGVPQSLAGFAAAAHHLYSVMGVVEASARTGQSMRRIAQIYFALGETLQLNWFSRQLHEYQADTQWQALARETLQDDLSWQQVALTLGVVAETRKSRSTDALINQWLEERRTLVDRWLVLQAQMKSSDVLDPAVFTVGIRELLDLAQASRGAAQRF